MSKKKILGVDVYLERRKSRAFVGTLERDNDSFIFKYHEPYIYDDKSIPLGPDLQLNKRVHKSSSLFPSFEDRMPSKRNPAYKEYCEEVGISPKEKDPIVLVATIGQKGPSSFIFVPVYENQFTKENMINFRKDLNLSIREFAELFDFSPATIQRIESGKTSGKDSLKRIELYSRFPEVALFELRRSGYKISDDIRQHVKTVLVSRKRNENMEIEL